MSERSSMWLCWN